MKASSLSGHCKFCQPGVDNGLQFMAHFTSLANLSFQLDIADIYNVFVIFLYKVYERNIAKVV